MQISVDHVTPELLRTRLSKSEWDQLQALLAEKAAIEKRIFFPTPRQQMVLDSPADIIGYGGAAGGGKSYLVAGLSVSSAKRASITRPQKNQTKKFVQEITKILGTRDGYASQNSSWTFTTPDGVERYIEFFGLDNPGDEEKQQGVDFDLKCVGAGTLVWMADGSRKAVEQVAVGDWVDTLEGPSRVTRTMQRVDKAVRVVTSSGQQVQGASHRLLGPYGWCLNAVDEPHQVSKVRDFSLPTPNLASHICAGSLLQTSVKHLQLRDNRCLDPLQLCARLQDREDRRSLSVTGVETVYTIPDNDCGSRCDQHQEDEQHLSQSLQFSMPDVELRHQSEYEEARQARHSGDDDGLRPSSLRGLKERCSCACYHDDEQLRLFATIGRSYPLQPIDAEQRNPIYLLDDAGRQTPIHSRHKWLWPHPYTKETRTTDRPARVEFSEHFDAGCVTLFDLTVEGANHYITNQGFINKNCYDEVTQMREQDIRYTLTWNRTDDPTQRVRSILTFNPPTTADGRWVIRFFRPWLDPQHPNPAKDGELRWFATVGDDKDYEVRGPQPFIIKYVNGSPTPWYSFKASDYRPTEIITPKSRTFIRALVTDNPYYMATGYINQLQSLPEPLRSQMLEGDFMAGVEDDARQVIPTKWIDAAMDRWRQLQPRHAKGQMDSIGVDAARGGNMGSTLGATGNDEMVIAPRYGTYFDELIIHKGVDTSHGALASALIIKEIRDAAPVHLDVVGIGTSPYDFLTENNQHVVAFNGAASSIGRDASGLLGFANRRAELHWRMREALDPMNPTPIALPPDPQLAVDLAAPRWTLSKQGILIEPKADIIKRLGRSPDRGDAVMLANIDTPKRVMHVAGFRDIPSHLRQDDYEQRRLRELE